MVHDSIAHMLVPEVNDKTRRNQQMRKNRLDKKKMEGYGEPV